MRLWHRGVENKSDAPRPMFALVVQDRQGYDNHVASFGHELSFSPTCRDSFVSSRLAPLDNIRFDDDLTETPAVLALGRQELEGMRLTALQKRAASEGVEETQIEGAMDGDAPREGLIALLLQYRRSEQ